MLVCFFFPQLYLCLAPCSRTYNGHEGEAVPAGRTPELTSPWDLWNQVHTHTHPCSFLTSTTEPVTLYNEFCALHADTPQSLIIINLFFLLLYHRREAYSAPALVGLSSDSDQDNEAEENEDTNDADDSKSSDSSNSCHGEEDTGSCLNARRAALMNALANKRR